MAQNAVLRENRELLTYAHQFLLRPDRLLIVAGGLAVLALSLLAMQGLQWWATNLLANFHLHLAVLGAAFVGLAVVWRRWLQAGIGAAIVVANLGLVATQLPAQGAAVPPGEPQLRVMTVNVLFANQDVMALRRALEEWLPDVVLLQEINQRWKSDLAALRDIYPHQINVEKPLQLYDLHGTALISRLPIEEVMRRPLGGLGGRLTAARIAVGGRDVWLASTHLVKPSTPHGQRLQRVQLQELDAWAASIEAPLIVGGDFNGTLHMQQIKTMVRDRGFSTDLRAGDWRQIAVGTYPAWLPGLGLKIDHVFVRGATISRSEIVDVPGSDHRGIQADIILARPEKS